MPNLAIFFKQHEVADTDHPCRSSGLCIFREHHWRALRICTVNIYIQELEKNIDFNSKYFDIFLYVVMEF